MIRVVHRLILAQREQHLKSHTYQKRTYTSTSCKHFVAVEGIREESDLNGIFVPLVDYIDAQRTRREDQDSHSTVQLIKWNAKFGNTSEEQLKEQIGQVGCKVKIKWSKDEIGDSGWKPAWYVDEVQGYDVDTDVLTVHYASEPGCT